MSNTVQKSPAKRGRPRGYDPDTALGKATRVFWDAGFAATSLDAITAGTGINKPSLYAAFGDKHALYRQALLRYGVMAQETMQDCLRPDRPLREGLHAVYQRALSLYYTGEQGARGCFLIGTALTESVLDAEVRKILHAALREIDEAFAGRFRLAQQQGELAQSQDAVILAKIASAVLHTLAIRSRAGESRAALTALIEPAVRMICGAPAWRPAQKNPPATASSRRHRRTIHHTSGKNQT